MDKKDNNTRKDLIDEIIESLGKDNKVSRTTLVGEAGIGKTWLAKEVSKSFTKDDDTYSHNVIWLHLNRRIENKKALYEYLATQLSLISEFEEGEKQNEIYNILDLEEKIEKEIKKNQKKNLLLILDDAGSMTTEDSVMEGLELRSFLKQHVTLKTLVTRREEKETSTTSKENVQSFYEKEKTIQVSPLTETQSLCLFKDSQQKLVEFTTEDWPDLLKRLCDNKEIEKSTLTSCIFRKSKGLPAAIVVLTKSLERIKLLSAKQRQIFKELILSSESLDAAAASKNAIDLSRYNPVLRLSYELLKHEEEAKSPIIACFWHIMDFYKYSGCAYYRDLIVHWMLEGYFDPIKSVEKAYQEGHSILMKFINRGILKIQEDNMVVPEVSMSKLLDLQDCGFFGRSCLGFDRVYGGDKGKGLGRIVLLDDMIQTVKYKKSSKKEKNQSNKKIKTIIVSGNRLRREIPNKFFEKKEMQNLEVVVLFDPTFDGLVQSLSNLKKLRVLVIRDCDLIQNIDELRKLERLHVLEVSGASYLKNIPDDFFTKMTELQSLNLSGLAISSSPSSIENLSMLRCFILRDCSELQDLPNFNVETKKLEVIDIRGARKLMSYFDKVKNWKDYKGKNKNFAHLRQLEHLDFSDTQIIRLPIFHLKDSTNDFSTMPALTRLLLRNCTNLKRLPHLYPLTKLQILDVSGATSLVEMLEVCLEGKDELRILDISETLLPELADTINGVIHLNQLLIRNCSEIKELPTIEELRHLEVFDVSGCDKLVKIDGSFENMTYLHEVNLSGTSLSELPDEISELSNIKKLIIRDCSKLKALPNLEMLTNLEILDVSGCTELDKIEGSFENLSYLREVNLSGTKLKTFPELPKKSILSSSKRIVLTNTRSLERDDWNQIKEYLAKDPEGSTFSNGTEKASEESKKLVHGSARYKILDPELPPVIDIVEINKSVNLGTEIEKKAEYVCIVENDSESVSSINLIPVKGCWVERCKNMENLFKVDERQEKEQSSSPLETLWISNLPLLTSLYSSKEGFFFKNLKMLTIDCCPSIKSLFPEIPDNLEVLRVKFCDKLERLFERKEVGKSWKLRKLQLLDLPVLSELGAKFPNLKHEERTIKKCPKLPKDELMLTEIEISQWRNPMHTKMKKKIEERIRKET